MKKRRENVGIVSNEFRSEKSDSYQKRQRFIDKMDELIADRRLRELQEGKVRTIPADEVWKELGI
jgi:hypothetical protein